MTTSTEQPTTAPAATTQAAETPEASQQDKNAKMSEIVSRMAGGEPKPPSEPAKKTEEPKVSEEPAKPQEQNRNKKLLEKNKEYKTRLADLESKYAELAAKFKDGNATEFEKFRLEQIQEQSEAISRERLEAYQAEAMEALGEKYEEFSANSEHYTPVLNEHASEFAEAVSESPNKFRIMHDLYQCFNDGSIRLQDFCAKPVQWQLAMLKRQHHINSKSSKT